MKKLLKNHQLLLAISGVVLILFGIIFLVWPTASWVWIAIFLGVGILISGISEIIASLTKPRSEYRGLLLAGGILDLLFGVLILFSPWVSAEVFQFIGVFFLAIWAIVRGAVVFSNAFYEKKLEGKLRRVGLILGTLLILAGFVLIFNVAVGKVILTAFIAAAVIMQGISFLFLAGDIKRLTKTVSKIEKSIEEELLEE
ncbi:MAG: DUF308 domain-containing protein [Candidatus Absconditabacteria bacterium]|nr:DUF308 domain-containing protein [Candidatus Absconditabacteria bacterium]MDD3868796.1 DUF308 domain-containing protein [Candidatus Absconditabacteria bacterium]MDD4714185.1 DUF308 domain-containing protein [Candidatus Absconditabacteria bacterium]